MAIGDVSGYSALGLMQGQNPFKSERAPVTLDAKSDPKAPYEYSVQATPRLIPPPEKTSDIKNVGKRVPQNTDPVSRAFNAVAAFESRINRIDVFI